MEYFQRHVATIGFHSLAKFNEFLKIDPYYTSTVPIGNIIVINIAIRRCIIGNTRSYKLQGFHRLVFTNYGCNFRRYFYFNWL